MAASKTIRRNSKVYNTVLSNAETYTVYTLSNEFRGRVVDVEWARENLLTDAKRSKATMSQRADGTFFVSWNSNRWYRVSL